MLVTLSVTDGPAKGQTYSFDEPNCFLFGRAADNRAVIAGDPMVSAEHFTLVIAPASVLLRDHSSNGTYVNGVRYGGKNALPPGAKAAPDGALESVLKGGEVISVGTTKIRVAVELPPEKTQMQVAAPEGFEGTMVQQQAPTQIEPAAPAPSAPAVGAAASKTYVPPKAHLGAEAVTKPAALPPQTPVFEGYRIESVLGRGGMGMVYRATDEKTGRVVAIKTVLPAKSDAEKMAALLEREIQVQRQLKHPNVIELIALAQSGPILGIVLELADGPDVGKLLQQRGGRLSLSEAAPIMLGALTGLGVAHAMGVIHRDLKPENIFLCKDASGWLPKVADFGLAKNYDKSGSKSLLECAGTPPYWPREHLTSYQDLYPPSDVFSIAAVFHLLLTGRHARDGMSEMIERQRAAKRGVGPGDYCQVIMQNRIVPLAKRDPAIPDRVARVIDKALSEDHQLKETIARDKNALRTHLAEQRYANASAFLDALRMALKGAH